MPTTETVNIILKAHDQVSSVFKNVVGSITGRFTKIGSEVGRVNQSLKTNVAAVQRSTSALSSGFASAERQLSSFSKTFDKFNQRLAGSMEITAATANIQQLGQQITSALKAPVTAAMSFESAMADVKKVVDFPTPTALKELEKTLFRMSTVEKIPLSPEDLSAIAAAAGQLGVNLKDIPDFTRVVAKMSTAFDMLASDAGDSMAKLSNIYQIPITEMERVGDAINHLSNNTAAKANEMVNVLGRIGGVSKAFGLTVVQASALADAFLALGKSPEIAATGINAMLTKLSTASKQTDKFQKALQLLNIDARDLEKAIGQDAQGALTDFLKTLEKVDPGKRMGVLTDLFGLEYSDDVAALVGGLKEYEKALKHVGDEANYAGSMQGEFESRAATTANTIQLLKNRAHILGITIGNVLLPVVNQAAGYIGKLVDRVTLLAEANGDMVKKVALAAAGFGGFLLSMAAVGSSVHVATASIAALKLSIGLVLSPIGLMTAALATGATLIYKNWSAVKSFFSGFFDGLKLGFSPIQTEINKLITALNPIKQALSPVINLFKQLFEPITRNTKAILEFYTAGHTLGSGLASVISGTIKLITSLVTRYSDVGVAIIETVGSGVTKGAKALWNAILSVFDWVADLFPHSPAKAGPFSELVEWGESLIATFAQGVVKAGKYLWEALKRVFEVAKNQVTDLIEKIAKTLKNIDFSGFADSILDGTKATYNYVVDKFTALTKWVNSVFDKIDLSGFINAILDAVKKAYQFVTGKVTDLIEWVSSAFDRIDLSGFTDAIGQSVKSGYQLVIGKVTDLIEWVSDAFDRIDFSGMAAGAWEAIKAVHQAITNKVTDLIEWVGNAFSRVDFSGMLSSIGTAIKDVYNYVIGKVSNLTDWIVDAVADIDFAGAFNSALNKINGVVSSFKGWLFTQIGKAIKFAFENPAIGAAVTAIAIAFQRSPIVSYITSNLIPTILQVTSALGSWTAAFATIAVFFGRFIRVTTGIGIAITLAIRYREELGLIADATKLLAADIAKVDFSQMWADTNWSTISGFFQEMYTNAQKFFAGTFAGNLLDNIKNLAGFFQENYKWIGVFGVALTGLIAKFTLFKRKDPCAGNPLAKCFKKQTQQLIEIQKQQARTLNNAQSNFLPGRTFDGECSRVYEKGEKGLPNDRGKKKPSGEVTKKSGVFSHLQAASLAATTAITGAWKKAQEAVKKYVDQARFTGSIGDEGSQSEINRRTYERQKEIEKERGYRSRPQRRQARSEAQSEVTKQASAKRTFLQSIVVAAADFPKKIGSYLALAKGKIAGFVAYLAASTVGKKIAQVFGAGWALAKGRVIAFFAVLNKSVFISTAAAMAVKAFGVAVALVTSPVGIVIAAVAALAGAAYLIYRNWGNLGPFFSNLWQQVTGFFTSYGTKIVNFLNEIWPGLGSLVGAIGNLFVGLGTTIGHVWDAIISALKLDFAGAGSALLQALGSGIKAAGTFLYDAFFSVLEMFGLYLPHSDAQKGPLSTLTQSGMAIPMTLAKGIVSAGSALIDALASILTQAWDYVTSFDWSGIGNKVFQGAKGVATNAITSARSNVPGYDTAINKVSAMMGKIFGDPLAEVDPTESGKAAVHALGKGVEQAGDEPIKKPLRGTLANTDKLLPHSDAEEGPFSTLTQSGMAIPQQLAFGVEQNQQVFIERIQAMMQQATSVIANASMGMTDVLSQGMVAPALATGAIAAGGVASAVPGLPTPKVMNVSDKGAVTDIIRQKAKEYGIAEEDFLRFAAIETGNKFDPRAHNKKSGAKGLFQFIPSSAKAYGIAGREFDASANTDAAARMYRDNMKTMKKFGIETSAANMYLAHQQGVGGLKQLHDASLGKRNLTATAKRNMMANVDSKTAALLKGKSDQEQAKIFLEHWKQKFAAIDVSKITQSEAGKARLPVAKPAVAMAAGTQAPEGGKFTEKGLTLKSREAIAGGGTKEGTFALGHAIEKNVEGFKYFTAFDDAYHRSAGYQAKKRAAGKSIYSPHNAGRALDFTLKDPTKSAQASQQVKDILAQAGVQGRVIDEYKIKTAGGTGGHIHVDFKSDADAEKFKQFMLGASQTSKAVATATTGLNKAAPNISENLDKSAENINKATPPPMAAAAFVAGAPVIPSLPQTDEAKELPAKLPTKPTLPDILRQETVNNINNNQQDNRAFQSSQQSSSKSITVNVGDVKVMVEGGNQVDVNTIGQQIRSQIETAFSNNWRGSMFDI